MLHLHFANHTERLAELLLDRLDGPRDDPFSPDTVVVPSAALQRGLTLAIARRHGVCAHTRGPGCGRSWPGCGPTRQAASRCRPMPRPGASTGNLATPTSWPGSPGWRTTWPVLTR